MRRCGPGSLLSIVVLAFWAQSASAQQTVDARWVWFDDGNPAESAPAGRVWFRKEYKAEEPSTGSAIVACDDEFVLWVNGQKIGQGGGLKSYLFNLNGIVGRGTNVFAIEATNKSGRAGLFVDAEIRGQGGHKIPCDTGADWKATREAPQGDGWLKPRFDDAKWKAVKVIAAHADSPWKEIAFTFGDLDRFQLPPGFQIKRIAETELVGSLVAMTWGDRGRLIVSREYRRNGKDGKEGTASLLALTDTDGDGTYDKAVDFAPDMKNCQGLCQVHDDLFVVGEGPQGTGLYRLADRDHDDQADEIVLLNKPKGGMGEHGPHDVVYGPDGWLYHNLGNHAWIENTLEPNTPCRSWEEGNLLEPAFEDAGGHAVGIRAPGGTIWRFTPDGKKWWAETVGFRNQYDICFNQQGDLFTFDSDMEWDVNLPWYRPVRINHCIPGAEFGWRSGAKIWPDNYFDSLPTTVDIGRGSPTGVVFYEHTQFPEKYRGAMLNCDWSMGRIIVAYLERDGATYKGKWDNLVTGNPLNVSDIEIDRDGSVVFCTGGRNTEGGIYRVTYTGGAATTPKTPVAETLDDALALPQPQAAWSRELAAAVKTKLKDAWAAGLTKAVKSGTPAQKVRALMLLTQQGPKPDAELLIDAGGDPDPKVRQFATWLMGDSESKETFIALSRRLEDDSHPVVLRRACEAFVRRGLEAPVEPLLKLLAGEDRWLRFAARIALERVPTQKWKTAVLGSKDPGVVLLGLLALHRTASSGMSAEETATVLESIHPGDPRVLMDCTRMLQLTLLRGGPSILSEKLRNLVATAYTQSATAPSRSVAYMNGVGVTPLGVTAELARIIAVAQIPQTAALVAELSRTPASPQEQIHYALCLRYLKTGWTFELKKRYLDWYETTRDLEGGNSLQGYLQNIVTGTLENYTPEERKELILAWKERPHATRVVLSASQPDQVRDFEQVVSRLLADVERDPGAGGQEMFSLTVDALGKSAARQSQALLRKLFDENADRRDLLARAIARHPVAENIPYLERAIASTDKTTMQVCIAALGTVDYKPANPDEIRNVILAGLKLGNEGGKAVVGLLAKWTRSTPENAGDIPAAIAHFQQWFREKYPDEPSPEMAQADTEKTKYTVNQLVEFLDNDPAAAKGDAARGREVLAKANCLKCHRFLKEGEGVGPDLTSVRRRFQKKEIIESVLLPSQVISDQYMAVTVVTTEGLVHTGMPLPNPGSRNLLLLLPDATKLEIAPEKVEEKAKAKISVMPEGLFKDLSLEQIADLFAFLETSKNNPEPAPAPAGK
jgi:putative membrane-bound dehydrogenase-like protein